MTKSSQYNIEKRVTEDDEEDEDDDYTFGPRPKQDDNQAPMLSKSSNVKCQAWKFPYFWFTETRVTINVPQYERDLH